MSMRDNVFYMENEENQHIDSFIYELLEARKTRKRDVVGVYDMGAYGRILILKVFEDTTYKDLKAYYLKIHRLIRNCKRSKFVVEKELELLMRNPNKANELMVDKCKWALGLHEEFPSHHFHGSR